MDPAEVPAFPFIELPDHFQQQKSGGVDVRGQFGDFFSQVGQSEVAIGVGQVVGNCFENSIIHGVSPDQ
jgi:hypothetical protein